jgi:hypothetical protein
LSLTERERDFDFFFVRVGRVLPYFLVNHFPTGWWIQGAELAADEGRSAAALAACRTLAEELTEVRFPAPRILAFKVRFLMVNDSQDFGLHHISFPFNLVSKI